MECLINKERMQNNWNFYWCYCCTYLFSSSPSRHLTLGTCGRLLRGQLNGRHCWLAPVARHALAQEHDTHIVAHAVRTKSVHIRYRAHLGNDGTVIALIAVQRAHDHNKFACQAIASLGRATKALRHQTGVQQKIRVLPERIWTYLYRQWAAVKTLLGAINDPPQMWPLPKFLSYFFRRMETRCFVSSTLASVPLIIRGCKVSSGCSEAPVKSLKMKGIHCDYHKSQIRNSSNHLTRVLYN